ncbi:hypothetical protein DLM75_08620 [Leptospira stimsonii]|uniref:Uncharacterized protein n=1 Tax=Leptospira stimsonii TaxID=2202203 RepID=A0A396Z8G4_9LEPT|nr:hypothetical protein DLM75_08620 [Leptospira stimsonii]
MSYTGGKAIPSVYRAFFFLKKIAIKKGRKRTDQSVCASVFTNVCFNLIQEWGFRTVFSSRERSCKRV